MILDKDVFTRKVEEFKEVGHEVRYREQMMVQEFSLSMIATGISISALVPRLGSVVGATIQIFGSAFLMLLTLHLRNINQDRLVALQRKDELRCELDYAVINQNLGGGKRPSAPRLMVWFAGAVTIAWMIWTAVALAGLIGLM